MTPDAPVKRCGLVIRVSTDGQARNPEGSLTNQLQRLRGHIDYKSNTCGENWLEAEQYILPGVSGKNSFRSKQFLQLFEDIRSGKVNTVLCTALDRICRSVKDFLAFFEILAEHNVEFVCLKQNYDTTSPQGRLFITIMMALAEFERDQTSDRNRETSLARSERGLWNGGYVIGYDLPPDGQKGTLVPNEREVALVNFAFDTYLKVGSILATAKVLNAAGYRTKEFQSRRGKFHPAAEFTWTGTLWLLTNFAYIGLKEINKKRPGVSLERVNGANANRRVPANWPPIVDEKKFYAVQKLMAANSKTKTNQVKDVKHCYVLNHGLLACGKCGSEMEGSSGRGRNGTRHYYYVCRNKECRFRIPAGDAEGTVMERIGELASQPEILTRLVAETNERLRAEAPDLLTKKAALEKELTNVSAQANGLLSKWAEAQDSGAGSFIQDRLKELGQQRMGLEATLSQLELQMGAIERESVDENIVRKALEAFTDVFEELPPYQRKELVGLVLSRAEISEGSLSLEFYGRPSTREEIKLSGQNKSCPDSGVWLPKCNSIRTRRTAPPGVWFRILHVAPVSHNANPGAEFHEQTVEIALGPKGAFENGNLGTLKRRVSANRVVNTATRARRPAKPPRQPRTPRVVELLRKAQGWRRQLDAGEVSTQAEIARREGITRARVTQVMGLLRLVPEIQQHVLSLPDMARGSAITERALRPISQFEKAPEQKASFRELMGRFRKAKPEIRSSSSSA